MVLAFALAAPAPAPAAGGPDPLLREQWALSDPDAIGAKVARSQARGAGVLVAVLDTGLQLDHPDLARNVWRNTRELAGNKIDDDANGFVDDVHGANMFKRDGDVDDDNDHGTHIAGIIAARLGNGIGGSGLAPRATILPVKVLDSNMSGHTEALADGIRYAVDQGAKILSVSVNGDASTGSVTAAVRYAGEHGAVVVASAGNDGRDIDARPSFPASLSDPALLSVTAADPEGRLWKWSNTGNRSVDLAAPGVHIVSTANQSSFQSRTGTSGAAPFAAASLALLSEARRDLPMSALRAALVDSARRPSATASRLAAGHLDVGAAMRRVLAGMEWKDDGSAGGPKLRLRTKTNARAGASITLRWSARRAASVKRWRVALDGRVIETLTATGETARISRRISRSGRHQWRVVGFDGYGKKIVSGRRAFRISRR